MAPLSPTNPVVFTVPEHCPRCGESGSINMERTVKADAVDMEWHCRKCSHSWSVERVDRLELRPKADRRQMPERRKPIPADRIKDD